MDNRLADQQPIERIAMQPGEPRRVQGRLLIDGKRHDAPLVAHGRHEPFGPFGQH